MSEQNNDASLTALGKRWKNNHLPTANGERHRASMTRRINGQEETPDDKIVFGNCYRNESGVIVGGDLSLARELDEALRREADKER